MLPRIGILGQAHTTASTPRGQRREAHTQAWTPLYYACFERLIIQLSKNELQAVYLWRDSHLSTVLRLAPRDFHGKLLPNSPAERARICLKARDSLTADR